MNQSVAISLAALAGLAACAPRAADPSAIIVTEQGLGVFEISGRLFDDHEDSRIHCAAARHARARNAAEMNWIAGVVQTKNGADQSAQYRYFAAPRTGAALPEGEVDKVFGEALPVQTWLGHCRGNA